MPDTGTAGNWLWFDNTATSATITTSCINDWWTQVTTATTNANTITSSDAVAVVWRYVRDRRIRMQAPPPPLARYAPPDAERPEQVREASISAARKLLLSHLSHSQRRQFLRDRSFVVRGGDTGRRYRIRGPSFVQNIEWLDGEQGERVFRRLCAHAEGHLMPWPDHLLAQKLNLEHAERDFLAAANVVPG